MVGVDVGISVGAGVGFATHADCAALPRVPCVDAQLKHDAMPSSGAYWSTPHAAHVVTVLLPSALCTFCAVEK